MTAERYRRRRKRAVLHLLFWLVFLVAAVFVISNNVIATTTFTISSTKLPSGLRDFTIVQLSDLHGKGFYNNESEHLISLLEDARPDLIVMTGDMVDNLGDLAQETTVFRNVARAAASIAPTYYITGNHEWTIPEPEAFLSQIESLGVHILRNSYEAVELPGGGRLLLAGIDDPNSYAIMPTLEEVTTMMRSEYGSADYSVLLCHRNDNLEQAAALGYDLVLCGHGHGGVVRLPIIGGLFGSGGEWFPKYDAGLFTEGSTKMIVSRGLGSHTKIPRWGSLPQIIRVELSGN